MSLIARTAVRAASTAAGRECAFLCFHPSAFSLRHRCPPTVGQPDRRSSSTVRLVCHPSGDSCDPRREILAAPIINIGRSWIDASTCDHLLVSLPFPLGPEFENVRVDAMQIRIIGLLPITAQ